MGELLPFWERRRLAKLANTSAIALSTAWKEKQRLKAAEKQQRKDFFQLMVSRSPGRCQNCDKVLFESMIINPRAIVCHVLPKRIFKSIQFEEENIVYLCNGCHHTLDNGGAKKVTAMRIFEVLKFRVYKLSDKILPEEKRHIPEYFYDTLPQ